MNSDSESFQKSYTIIIENDNLTFDYRRAIYWNENQTLILSDLHIGKTGHFRKNGIAISNASAEEDLVRLESLIIDYDPKKVLILGDLSHSRKNLEWQNWIDLRKKFHNLSFKLVPGNHDILSLNDYREADLELTEEVFVKNPFSFTHDPLDTINSKLNISGHIHPGVRLRGGARQSLTLPCFYISSKQIILPAFSSFTGRYKIKPKKGDKILAVTSKGLLLLAK